jgi:hypothetical protein
VAPRPRDGKIRGLSFLHETEAGMSYWCNGDLSPVETIAGGLDYSGSRPSGIFLTTRARLMQCLWIALG